MGEVKECLCLIKFVDYFSELIQPLATNECLEQIFQKLKEK